MTGLAKNRSLRLRGQRECTPLSGKIYCRKMSLFAKALLLATNFPNVVKNSSFIEFSSKISKSSQKFQTKSVFLANVQKYNSGFLKFVGNG